MNNQFPILDNYTYLNTANHGLVSQDLINYRVKLLESLRDKASLFTNHRNAFIDDVRLTIAQFVDASPDCTAVIPNFSTGFNILINDIDRSKTFLLLDGDYPSVNWPVENRGFKCRYATIDAQLEDNIRDAFKQQVPDFFCFSLVQYISGIKLDLDFIAALKKEYPHVIFIADLTQYVGCEVFRFRESGLDIILASCYKWLHAGDGNGFICVKEEIIDAIKPQTIGFRSTRNVIDALPIFIGRFEPGHQDMSAFGSLKFAMDVANRVGLDTISHQINVIAQPAREAFTARNLLDAAVIQRDKHSSIFNIRGDKALYERLLDNNIVTSLRGDGIRISFCHLNTQAHLKTLLDVLDL